MNTTGESDVGVPLATLQNHVSLKNIAQCLMLILAMLPDLELMSSIYKPSSFFFDIINIQLHEQHCDY